MNTLNEVRTRFVDYVEGQLVGPFGGPDEVIFDPPNRQYLMGILYPQHLEAGSFFESEGEQSEGEGPLGLDRGDATGEDRFEDSGVQSANDFLPSSVGISLLTTAPRIVVTVSGGRYAMEPATADSESEPGTRRRRTKGPGKQWRRSSLPQREFLFEHSGSETIWGDRAEVRVKWRSVGDRALITVTMLNAATADDESQISSMWDDMVLQAALTVSVPEGSSILEYPSARFLSADPEEAELRLQYRARKTYAVGHGCAAGWTSSSSIRAVWTESMPRAEVPTIVAAGDRWATALSLSGLATDGYPDQDLHSALDEFVAGYETWYNGQVAERDRMSGRSLEAADRILARIGSTIERMRAGAAILRSSPQALRAFRAANRAMLIQMHHSAATLAGSRKSLADAVNFPSSYSSDARWRPFQLGFALTSLAGLVESSRGDRGFVDLIWFPTGGGKTEAYLLLAAFEILHRRLAHGARGAGTTVISRYTLSLLTAQQFQRAATTICALDMVRRAEPALYGAQPISIGLWVGRATTPNRYLEASEIFDRVRAAEEPKDEFLLERCPWCGTEIVPRRRSDDDSAYGIRATPASFEFFCVRQNCAFRGGLPVHVVDDDLYDHPPTFLLGTVDKFAGLAWEPRSGVYFGSGGKFLRPSLIIQDELHLLTGPLGTIAGLYEMAINELCTESGCPPKVVASTATIRRADDQVEGLFGRDVTLFPPSGLTADESYFASVDDQRPGRMYVGIMAQGHTSDTATVHTASALLQAPVDLDLDGAERDAYWTLVAYHNSLRELGRTVTMALDDIPARLKALVVDRPRRAYEVTELTSNVPRSDQPRLLERLGLPFTDDEHIGMLASTNMLSVGVDVPRLGLMLVNGQPKATAEYIQATSRVGRSDTPGLVFGLFRATRPRDRSHYEGFRQFHHSLYRHVEPTSVTPFASPARDRALHAALIILVRHRLGLTLDDRAGEILENVEAFQEQVGRLVAVVERVEPREAVGARRDLEAFVESWRELALEARHSGRRLYYASHGKAHVNLMKDFNARGQGRETLRSMRNVDKETRISLHTVTGKAGDRT